MADLTPQDVKALGLAVGIDMQEPLLTEVTHNINTIRDFIGEVDLPGLDSVEPLPVIPPQLRNWPRSPKEE